MSRPPKPVNMTEDEIIASNPGREWRRMTFRGQTVLISTDVDGKEKWLVWKGRHHVSGPMPLSGGILDAAKSNLRASQPGREFATVGDDDYAKALRISGFHVGRGDDGKPRLLTCSV